MDESFKKELWGQFGASIQMLENAIKLCPDNFWATEKKFWYFSYHCLFWLDYYLTTNPDGYTPPAPYTLSEFDPEGALPERVYTKEELLLFLEHCRGKGRNLILGLTDSSAKSRWVSDFKDYSLFEIIIYNLRHVQHHTAQLNLLLRQEIDDAPKWVSVSD